MRYTSICLTLVIVLLCPSSSAQWASLPQSPRGTCLAVSGSTILVGRPEERGYHGALFALTDCGASWDTTSSFPVKAFAVSGTQVFAGCGDCVVHSSDNGRTWFRSDSIRHPVTSIAVTGTAMFTGTINGGIFRSSDNGQTWTSLSPEWTSTTVWTFAFSGATIFAGTTGGVVLSIDNGTSWPAANSGLPALDIRVLAVHGTKTYAGIFQTGVVLSSDNGLSWNQVDMGLSNHCGGRAFAFYGDYVFAGTDCGVFLSSNGGATWAKTNNGLTDTLVLALAVSGANLLALTSTGVFTRPLTEMTSVSASDYDLPSSFDLDQNYPNPFNGATKIGFGLPAGQAGVSCLGSRVKLAVYDLLGREVAVLMDEEKLPGRYQLEFDGTRLSSGMYICCMRAGDFMSTKKLVLIR
jgi:hypothetical protein